jgi:hypothetical protein
MARTRNVVARLSDGDEHDANKSDDYRRSNAEGKTSLGQAAMSMQESPGRKPILLRGKGSACIRIYPMVNVKSHKH